MDALREAELSGGGLCRRVIKCGMGRVFPGYEGGLRPEFRCFIDGYELIPEN